MSVQRLLDNAATASQNRSLLDPVTRGAVLRSVAQWISEHDKYDDFYQGFLVEELETDPEYNL